MQIVTDTKSPSNNLSALQAITQRKHYESREKNR